MFSSDFLGILWVSGLQVVFFSMSVAVKLATNYEKISRRGVVFCFVAL
jgi:hypothetical protein